jgi:hypothetical protein
MTVTPEGLSVEALGGRNEEIQIVALQPKNPSNPSRRIMEWTIHEKTVRFEASQIVVVEFRAGMVSPGAIQA